MQTWASNMLKIDVPGTNIFGNHHKTGEMGIYNNAKARNGITLKAQINNESITLEFCHSLEN